MPSLRFGVKASKENDGCFTTSFPIHAFGGAGTFDMQGFALMWDGFAYAKVKFRCAE